MSARQLELVAEDGEATIPLVDFVVRASPLWNWIALAGILSVLHFSIAIPAFFAARWEGYMSLIFGSVFATIAIALWRIRSEVAILTSVRVICIRHRLGRFGFNRTIEFESVHGVRLCVPAAGSHSDAKLEILCDNEDVECPLTNVPRQQALYLAMAMGVQLIKVFEGASAE